jgi:hypothetical protein
VTEAYCAPEGGAKEAKKSVSKRRRKEGRKDGDVTFSRYEDEAWMDAAEDLVTWPIVGELPGAQGLIRSRMAMVVSASKIKALRAQTSRIVGLSEDDDRPAFAPGGDEKGDDDDEGNALDDV